MTLSRAYSNGYHVHEALYMDVAVQRLYIMLCGHAYMLALPLGLRPLGMLSERWQAHQHGKAQDINVKYKCLAMGGGSKRDPWIRSASRRRPGP